MACCSEIVCHELSQAPRGAAEADQLRQKWGRNELAEKNKSKLKILFEQVGSESALWRCVGPRGRSAGAAPTLSDLSLPSCAEDPGTLCCFPQFTAPMPMMIWAAVAIEGGIENWADFGILLGLQIINGSVGLCVLQLFCMLACCLPVFISSPVS